MRRPKAAPWVGALLATLAVAGCHRSTLSPAPTDAPAPHLLVKLRPGCRLAPDGGHLVSAEGRVFDPSAHVAPGTRIEPRVPEYGSTPGKPLDPDEEKLARYIQIVFPRGHDPAAHLPGVREWPCVESAELAPEVSLP